MIRATLLAALALGCLAAALAAFTLGLPWSTTVDIGGGRDEPYLRGFYPAERNERETYRWTTGAAVLRVPGAGAGATVRLRLLAQRPGDVVRIDAGGGSVELALRGGWQELRLAPRPQPWSGDLLVRVESATRAVGDDPRRLGVVVDRLSVRGGGAAPLGPALGLGASTALLVLLGGWATGQRWPGPLLGAALAAVGAGLLAGGGRRLLLAEYSGRLALTLALALALALAAERLLSWLDRRGWLRAGRAARHGLACAALLAFLLRFGAMAFPLSDPTDLRFSLARAGMVRGGQFLKLFLPNPTLTPFQWEIDGPIPRSPLYYAVTAPLTALPGAGPELGLKAFSSLADALAALLVGLLVLRAGAGGRAAGIAALLAATLPLGVMLIVEWGIFPTLLAQALALLALLLWLALRPQLHKRWAQATLAAALALAYVAYPTALMFLGLTWALLVALLALRRDPAALPTLGAGALAALAALALFYGWHVPALLGRTLPALLARGEGDSPDPVALGELWDAAWVPLLAHFGPLALLLAGGGAALLLASASPRLRGARPLLLAWCLAYLPLALANGFFVTFILKHLLYVLPLVAALGGLLLGRLSRSSWGRLAAGAAIGLFLWQALALELRVLAG